MIKLIKISCLIIFLFSLLNCGEGLDILLIKDRIDLNIYVNINTGNDENPGTKDAPFKTIQNAIDYAISKRSNANILVAEGTYSAAGPVVVLKEGILLYGGYSSDFKERDLLLHETIISDSSNSGGTESEPTRAIESEAGVTAAVVDGFTVIGGTGEYTSAVFLKNTSNVVISENKINGGIATGNAYGMYIENSVNTLVENNTINGGDSALSYGIQNINTSSIIRKNNIDGGHCTGTSFGIYVHWETQPETIISHNIINMGHGDQYAHGIYTENSSSVIYNNVIQNENMLRWTNGIFLRVSADHTDNNASPVVRNNTIDCGYCADNAFGFFIWNDSVSFTITPIIQNNIIISTGGSAGSVRYGFFEYFANQCPASVQNNDVFKWPDALYFIDSTTDAYQGLDSEGSFSVNSNGSGATLDFPSGGGGNINTDPKFTNASNHDYSLSEATPDSVTGGGLNGIDLDWGFADDITGDPRPSAGNWSIGAYEY